MRLSATIEKPITNDATMWGITQEADAMTLFIKKHPHLNVSYFGVTNPKYYEYNDFVGGSPDGIFTSHNDDGGIIEIKCPFNTTAHLRHLRVVDATSLLDISPEYYWQIVANMLFTGTKMGYFVSYDPRIIKDNLVLHIVPIIPTDSDIELLKERIAEAVKFLRTEVGILTEMY